MQCIVWKRTSFHRVDIGCKSSFDIASVGHKVVHKFGHFAQVNTQHIVQHQHLPSAAVARADADGVAAFSALALS